MTPPQQKQRSMKTGMLLYLLLCPQISQLTERTELLVSEKPPPIIRTWEEQQALALVPHYLFKQQKDKNKTFQFSSQKKLFCLKIQNR